MKKRMISMFLSIVMLLTLLPASTFAVDTATQVIQRDSEIVTESFSVDARYWLYADFVQPEARSIFLEASAKAYDKASGYGGQLTANQKKLYDALVSKYVADNGLCSASTDSLTYTPVSGSMYTSTVQSDICYAYFAFSYDYPQVFWNSGYSAGYSYWPDTQEIAKIEITLAEKYTNAKTVIASFNSGVIAAVNAIRASVTDTSVRGYYKAIHDWLCQNLSYNYAALTNPGGYPQAYSSSGVFAGDGSVVCQGYSEAFKILCDYIRKTYRVDLYTAIILGSAESRNDHMWNYAYMPNGNWYAVDVCWDDQTFGMRDTYFLCGRNSQGLRDKYRNERKEENAFDSAGTVEFTYPVIEMDYYHGSVDDTLTSLEYLAFSNLVYDDFATEKTVYEIVKPFLSNRVWPDTKSSVTYSQLYSNIMNWECVSTANLDDGFYAATFYSSVFDQYVISFRGSINFNNILSSPTGFTKDWIRNDIPYLVFNQMTARLDDAYLYYKMILSQFGITSDKVRVTGHSLGGALAQVVSLRDNVSGEVFNSASPTGALYSADDYGLTKELGASFTGLDRYKCVKHIIEDDPVGSLFDLHTQGSYRVHESNTSAGTHALASFVSLDKDGKAVMTNVIESGGEKAAFMAPVTWDRSFWYWGTSQNDTGSGASIGAIADNAFLYGGDGNDNIVSPFLRSKDRIVGGNSTICDRLDGGFGNDTYYYYIGNGIQYIEDVHGKDSIIICGAEEKDSITVSDDLTVINGRSYLTVYRNEEPIVYLNSNRARGSTCTINVDRAPIKSELKAQYEKAWMISWEAAEIEIVALQSLEKSVIEKQIPVHFIAYLIQCPTSIDIVDEGGNVVLTLKDNEEQTLYTEYGNFYAFWNEQTHEWQKKLELVADYSVKIHGTDDGTMDIAVCLSGDESPVFRSVDISVNPELEVTLELDDDSHFSMQADSDGDGVMDSYHTVTFRNGSSDEIFIVKDGEGLTSENIPPIIDGVQGKWENVNLTNITEDILVLAVANPTVTGSVDANGMLRYRLGGFAEGHGNVVAAEYDQTGRMLRVVSVPVAFSGNQEGSTGMRVCPEFKYRLFVLGDSLPLCDNWSLEQR